jgi:hypothetical protein
MPDSNDPHELCMRIGSDIRSLAAGPATAANMRNLLELIAKTEWLRKRLFRHPLGFFDFPASQIFVLPWKARLHIWRDAERGAAHSNIHWHDSNVTSYVAAGQLADVQYDTETEGIPTHAHYEVEYSATASRRIRREGRYSLRLRAERTHKSGTTYSIARHIFHKTIISPETWPVTFMVSHDQGDLPPVALGPLDGPCVVDYPHVSDLSEAETMDLVRQAIEKLDDA